MVRGSPPAHSTTRRSTTDSRRVSPCRSSSRTSAEPATWRKRRHCAPMRARTERDAGAGRRAAADRSDVFRCAARAGGAACRPADGGSPPAGGRSGHGTCREQPEVGPRRQLRAREPQPGAAAARSGAERSSTRRSPPSEPPWGHRHPPPTIWWTNRCRHLHPMTQRRSSRRRSGSGQTSRRNSSPTRRRRSLPRPSTRSGIRPSRPSAWRASRRITRLP